MEDRIHLKSDRLEIDVLRDGTRYQGSRYDWSGIIEQVCLDKKHTFCSEERYNGEYGGMKGIGLCGVFEWADTHIYDSIPAFDSFPLLGVGLLRKPDNGPFIFNKPHVVEPFTRETEYGENWIKIHTLPRLCCGVAVDQLKAIAVEGNAITIEQTLKNVGSVDIEAVEFNHNFIKFDGETICSDYWTTLPYSPAITLRRGELTLTTSGYKPQRFDEVSGSLAFRIRGCEGLNTHWMKTSNCKTGTYMLVQDDFPVSCMYCFTNPDTFSTETYKPISLKPGEEMSYTRRYSFGYIEK